MYRESVIGWTRAQWVMMAGQKDMTKYPPNLEGALEFRKDWIASDGQIDVTKANVGWAEQLFRNTDRGTHLYPVYAP